MSEIVNILSRTSKSQKVFGAILSRPVTDFAFPSSSLFMAVVWTDAVDDKDPDPLDRNDLVFRLLTTVVLFTTAMLTELLLLLLPLLLKLFEEQLPKPKLPRIDRVLTA